MNMLNLPKKVYFKRGAMNVSFKELTDIYAFKRAFIVSDAKLYAAGVAAPVVDFLRERGIRTAEFFTLSEVPTIADVKSGLPKMLEFEPEVIIAIGGGSVISAAKAMWIQYENPEIDLAEVAEKFGKLTGTDVGFPTVGAKAKLAVIPTTFGTGAQNSPFAVLADGDKKLVIASYKLLPEISATDPEFADTMTPEMIKANAIALLSQAIRAYAAPGSNCYTQGVLAQAVMGALNNAEAAMNGCPDAMYKLCNAGALLGYGVGNAVETIDPNAAAYPTAKEKGAEDPKVDALAKDCGLADAEALIAAVAAIAEL